jgi:long-chain acyl-CoA synthetase
LHRDLAEKIGWTGHRDGLLTVQVEPPLLLERQYGRSASVLSTIVGPAYRDLLSPIPGLDRPPAQARGAMPYTSGSTGRPKGVLRMPTAIDQAAEALRMRRDLGRVVFGIDQSSIALLAAPMYHSAPLSYALFCAAEGATVYLESKFDPLRTLAMIDRHRITHAYLVPTMYQRLLRIAAQERARFNVSSLRFVASTGSPCAAETKRAMIEWFGPVINEAYASSETGYITFIDSKESLEHPGSAGKPILNARVRILAEDGSEMPCGQVGLIYAHQPAYPDFTYLNNSAARRDMERDGLVTLGDMGYLDDEGYLFISDRKNDMVISGGVNIYPAEIEAVLNGMEGVLDCAIFGIPDPEFGEALAAAIELQPGHTLTEEEIRAYLVSRVARYKLPRTITFHAALPREETGKIFKRRLRDPYWSNAGRLI